MINSYRSLSPSLHATADAALDWFAKKWGVSKKNVKIEVAFDPDIQFRPTFVAILSDFHILCIEVSESIYNNTLDSVVIHCREKGLPIKLFVAVPKDISDSQFAAKLKAAKRAGVGIIEVDHQSGTIVQQPLALSLAGVRSFDLANFPRGLRQNIQHAHQTFIDGEPAKACSLIYDELESLCRKFAKKMQQKGFWANREGLNLDRDGWAPIMTALDRGLNRTDPTARKLTAALCARIIGVTTHRNEAGHKPKNLKELIKRDKALRTRFESAVDLLSEFIDAAKPSKIV